MVVRWLTTTRGLGTLECRTDEVIVHNALCFNSDGRRSRLVAGDGEPLGAVSVVAITEPPVLLTTFYGHDYRCFAFFLFLTLFHILTYCSHNFCFIPSPLKFPPQSPFQSPLIFMLNNWKLFVTLLLTRETHPPPVRNPQLVASFSSVDHHHGIKLFRILAMFLRNILKGINE